jgi:hypothetical protein
MIVRCGTFKNGKTAWAGFAPKPWSFRRRRKFETKWVRAVQDKRIKPTLRKRDIAERGEESFLTTTTTTIGVAGMVVVSLVAVLPDLAGAMTSHRVIDWVWAQAGEAGAKHV